MPGGVSGRAITVSSDIWFYVDCGAVGFATCKGSMLQSQLTWQTAWLVFYNLLQVLLSHEELPNVSFVISLAKPALVFDAEAIIALYSGYMCIYIQFISNFVIEHAELEIWTSAFYAVGDKKLADNLQTYLSSREVSNLKFEFQGGNGKVRPFNCLS